MRLIFLLFPLFLFSNSIVKYLNLKPFYYQNQIVILKIKVISNENNLSFFSPNLNIEVNKTNPYIYLLNVKFKADKNISKNIFIFPTKEIINLNNKIRIKTLNSPPSNFSHIFADNLKILNPISTNINNKIMLSFTIKATNANLEDFKIKDGNLTLLNQNEATYFTYLPLNSKNFIFYYFNTTTDNYKKISIPIILKEKTISTQTNINPEENKFFTPINILILIIIAIFLIIFLVYQYIILLIIPIILFISLIFPLLPKGQKILIKDSKVRILPTSNSTVFYISHKNIKVKILKKLKYYTKIKINNKIGWVKNENLR